MSTITNPFIATGKVPAEYFCDRKEETGLPKSDVVKFFLKDNSTITIRPSGTEPKLKIYFFANGQSRIDELKELFSRFIK